MSTVGPLRAGGIGFLARVAIPVVWAGIAGIWFAVVVGWAWFAVTSTHLMRRA